MKIVSVKTKQPYDLYIGRANKGYGLTESIFHNPYVIGVDGNREEVIKKFEKNAAQNPKILDNLWLIDGMILGCWYDYPKEDCHGRVLFELREHQKLLAKNIHAS